MRTLSTTVAVLCLLPGCYRSYQLAGGRDGTVEVVAEPDVTAEPDMDAVEPIPDLVEEEPTCAESTISMIEVVPDVLILLDRSGSMMTDIPVPPYRPLWHIITRAILEIVESPRDDEVWFGLMTFPGPSCGCDPPLPGDILVEPVVGAHDAIDDAFSGLEVCGGTPTSTSLQSALGYLVTSTTDHPKYVLLATDGAPNCNPYLDPSTCTCTSPAGCPYGEWCLDDELTYDVLDMLCEAGIKTFVLGMMGWTYEYHWVLQNMATHGCTHRFYAADDPEEIDGALDDIMRYVADCNVGVRCSRIPDPELVNFYLRPDGTVIPRSLEHEIGWDWVEACEDGSSVGQVAFFGEHCDHLLDRGLDGVRGAHGCPTEWAE
jgi:hypothetical protein